MRGFRSLAVAVLFACLLLAGLSATVSAQLLPQNPDFVFHIGWGLNLGDDQVTRMEVKSSVTRTMYSYVYYPLLQDTGDITVEVGSEGFSSLFDADPKNYLTIDNIVFQPSASLAPFLQSSHELGCLPGPEFYLEKAGKTTTVSVQNTTASTITVTAEDGASMAVMSLGVGEEREFFMDMVGEVRVYMDESMQNFCANLWFNFHRLDNIPVILRDDSFVMFEGEVITFNPLANDDGVLEPYGSEIGALPFAGGEVDLSAWTVVSPTAGIYTTTYTVMPTNGPAQSAQITLVVRPRERKALQMVSDVITATEGSTVIMYPISNDSGYTLEDVEFFSVTTESAISVTTSLADGSVVFENVGPEGYYSFIYEVRVKTYSYYWDMSLVVLPRPTNEDPTQQPTEPRNKSLFLAAINNR